MPEYTTSGIEYPAGGDPIRGNASDYIRTDLQRLAETADAVISQVKYLAEEAHQSAVGATIPQGADWNALGPGAYSAPSTGMGYLNAPSENPVGTLVISDARNRTGNIQTALFFSTNPATLMIRDRNTAGVWQPWREIGLADSNLVEKGSARREVVVDAGLKRRGGVIGTGGLPAIALRFDHHLTFFNSKVLPLLKKYRLPWGQMLNPGNFGKGNDAVDIGAFQGECFTSGGEVWNHSFSHADITFSGRADREITQGLSALKDAFPELHVDAFAPPGQPQMMGMEGSDTPEKFWGTYPGRLILAQHALVRGYYPGVYQPLTGPNLVGAPHSTMDKLDFAYVRGLINGAVATGSGLTLMLHPNYLDTSGYMSSADLEAVFKHVASLRDAKKLKVLSCAGILVAQDGVPARSMLASGAAGQVAGSWAEDVSSRAFQGMLGVPHEAEVWFTSSADGTVSLKVEVTHAGGSFAQEHAASAKQGVPVRLGVVVTPPLSTSAIRVSLSGAGSHDGIRYWPV